MSASGNGFFSADEQHRYSRQLMLPGFGREGQLRLKNSNVAVVGAGGLGSPVLMYLVSAGVGRISLVDEDVVHVSNLQRQVLFTTEDLGAKKAHVAARRLSLLNPNVALTPIAVRITSANAIDILRAHDVIVDCTDNFATRYLLNDASVLLDVPLVYAAIFRYEGQAAVFNLNRGPNYRDLYPKPPAPGSVPDCETGGVLGTLAGTIGAIQANETIKLLAGLPGGLAGKLLTFDSLTLETQVFQLPDQNSRSSIEKLIDYDDFCGQPNSKKATRMKEITVQDLKTLIDSKADFQLIDVREVHEYELCNLHGVLIPMAEVPQQTDRIDKKKQVVIHCRSGRRSGDIINWLEKNKGFTNLYNLKGGILAWAKEIDASMPVY